MLEPQNNFIPGIFNYCDRWCERCSLKARCRVYAMEQEYVEDERDASQKVFWRNLQNIFTETKEMLREAAAEKGIDIDQLDLAEAGAMVEEKRRLVEESELLQFAEKYTKQASLFLKSQNLNGEQAEQTRLEMLEVISWYHFFIQAKINRALYAEADYAEDADSDAFRSDGDGSIKIALIAIDRSLTAWKILLDDGASRELQFPIKLLETLRRMCEEKFPNARDFLRPGFDEIETVM